MIEYGVSELVTRYILPMLGLYLLHGCAFYPFLSCKVVVVMQEGVVFTISGIQNPERGQLRIKGLEMGAQYRPDWSTDCTVLVCAFMDTPKFKQVQADGGSIVSKVSNYSVFLDEFD